MPIGDDQGYVIGALTCKPSVMEDLGSFSLLQLDGPHRIWMLKKQMFYYALTAMHPKSPPTADEEKEEGKWCCVCNVRGNSYWKVVELILRVYVFFVCLFVFFGGGEGGIC